MLPYAIILYWKKTITNSWRICRHIHWYACHWCQYLQKFSFHFLWKKSCWKHSKTSHYGNWKSSSRSSKIQKISWHLNLARRRFSSSYPRLLKIRSSIFNNKNGMAIHVWSFFCFPFIQIKSDWLTLLCFHQKLKHRWNDSNQQSRSNIFN